MIDTVLTNNKKLFSVQKCVESIHLLQVMQTTVWRISRELEADLLDKEEADP